MSLSAFPVVGIQDGGDCEPKEDRRDEDETEGLAVNWVTQSMCKVTKPPSQKVIWDPKKVQNVD